MGRSASASSVSMTDSEAAEPEWPFGQIVASLTCSDLRETAYEIFFMSCRCSPGFTNRNMSTYPGTGQGCTSEERRDNGPVSPGSSKVGGTMMVVTSKIKTTLGMKSRRASLMRPMNQTMGTAAQSGMISPWKVKRPMTSAEIMRQQMRVPQNTDGRLRKTLMRSLVGQTGRRAETIILPLELLRQLKPADFYDTHEYYQWQRRQLRNLEAGLLLYPLVPQEKHNPAAVQLQEVLKLSELKAIDTSKNSETMRNLTNSVLSLAWRNPNGSISEVCHWADGFPLNIHLYLALLQCIFDLRDDTIVLDEVDELVVLIKKTWASLGINRMIHNVCFTWVLFNQYFVTGQIEPDLINATIEMLSEVGNDVKRLDREGCYVKVVSATLLSIQGWAEKNFLNYHESFNRGTMGKMEGILSLALSTSKIINEDVSLMAGSGVGLMDRDSGGLIGKLDGYIRSTMRKSFTKIYETGYGQNDSMIVDLDEQPSQVLVQLAPELEKLALSEKQTFSPILKRWHPTALVTAVATLHNCYGALFSRYLVTVTSLTNEVVQVLHSGGKLEKVLIQMVVDDNGGDDCLKDIKGTVPYKVDSIVTGLLKSWMKERFMIERECLSRAKETEVITCLAITKSWIPKSKTEPYAQTAVDLIRLASITVDDFVKIPVCTRADIVQELVEGIESIFNEYISFAATCGTKQSYLPALPPLTRCNRGSRLSKLWKKAIPSRSSSDGLPSLFSGSVDGNHPRPSTSRGTQRLYIRLNTLYYLHSHIQALNRSLRLPSFKTNSTSLSSTTSSCNLAPPDLFECTRSTIQSAILHVSEVAAYRLIFLDSVHSFYNGLYIGDMSSSRIRPALRILKQNLTLLVTVLTDRAQPGALKEVMKASFEAFLMVLLAGGNERTFLRSDCEAIGDDFQCLKKAFSMEGLVAEDVVEREAEVVDRIVELMGLPTDRLIENFSIAAWESSGMGTLGGGTDTTAKQRVLPMPPTTGRWNSADPNTLLRVLCHRNDENANNFLKRTFQLPKRK